MIPVGSEAEEQMIDAAERIAAEQGLAAMSRAQKIHVGPRLVTRRYEGMDDRPYERFTVRPLGPVIGAEIEGVDLSVPLADELRADVHRALLEWKVLFFRDQDITRDQQRDLAMQWGALHQHPFWEYTNPGQTAVDVQRLAKDAVIGGGENEWHSDITWHATPPFGAILRAIEVPEYGGDTLWADAASAYDGLDDATKAEIEHLSAVHDWQSTFGLAMPDEARLELAEHFPPVEHPIVRIHPETGRRMLYVNPTFTQYVVGYDEAASDALLARLYTPMRYPEYQCRFRWTPGSLAFWDNRATQHYASSDYFPNRRVMERVGIGGDAPFGPS